MTPLRPLTYRLLPLVLAGGLHLVAGCSLSDRHQLESSLRQNEVSIRQLEEQLQTARQQLRDQESELLALKQPDGDSRFHTASSGRLLESSVAWGAVDRLRIHELASGILRTPENTLMTSLIIQPLDQEGEVVKVAGELQIKVQQPGETRLLTDMTVTPLESRGAWSNGLIARGFQIEFTLPDGPAGNAEPDSHVLVTVVLDLGDDRQFKATQLIPVPAKTVNQSH